MSSIEKCPRCGATSPVVQGGICGGCLPVPEQPTDATRPIIGIENRSAQEVFDIMADRIRAMQAGAPTPNGEGGDFAWTATEGYKYYPPYVNLHGNRLIVRGHEEFDGEFYEQGHRTELVLTNDALDGLRAALSATPINSEGLDALVEKLRHWALDKSSTHHQQAHENKHLRAEHIASSAAYRNLAEELPAALEAVRAGCDPAKPI